jgi:hypothetical protein
MKASPEAAVKVTVDRLDTGLHREPLALDSVPRVGNLERS